MQPDLPTSMFSSGRRTADNGDDDNDELGMMDVWKISMLRSMSTMT